MIIKTLDLASSRRQFLLNALPAGTLFCFGCGGLLAMTDGQEKQKPPEKKHKFLEDSGMSYEEVSNFAFKDGYIPLIQNLAHRMKGSDFIEMLKSATNELAIQKGRESARKFPKNDFAAYKKVYSAPFWTF